MSFLDDIINVGSGVWDLITGPGVGPGIARATALGFLLKEVTDSIQKDNQKPAAAESNKPDYGVREQVDPDTDNSIPVVYGTAFLGGYVTDAVLTNGNQTMWYCLTICEKTGTLLSTGQDSVISIEGVYWNQNRIIFQSDGITAASFVDEEGNSSDSINGLIRFYFFNNGSSSPVVPTGYSNNVLNGAQGIFPNWTANHTMSGLVFCLVRVDYNKEKEVTGLGNIEFKIKNSMTQPGDCLYDYMTNSIYGAGIVAEEIYAS